NTITDYTGTVTFTSTDPYPAHLPADYTFSTADGGVRTFSGDAILYTAGTQVITATDTASSALFGSVPVFVTPAAATHFVIRAPSDVTAGMAFDITIEAQDGYGNVDTNYVTDPSGLVHLSTSDPDPQVVLLPADFQFTSANAGTFTVSVTLFSLGDQTLRA